MGSRTGRPVSRWSTPTSSAATATSAPTTRRPRACWTPSPRPAATRQPHDAAFTVTAPLLRHRRRPRRQLRRPVARGRRLWRFAFDCLRFGVIERGGRRRRPQSPAPYHLTGDVQFRVGEGCGTFDYGRGRRATWSSCWLRRRRGRPQLKLAAPERRGHAGGGQDLRNHLDARPPPERRACGWARRRARLSTPARARPQVADRRAGWGLDAAGRRARAVARTPTRAPKVTSASGTRTMTLIVWRRSGAAAWRPAAGARRGVVPRA